MLLEFVSELSELEILSEDVLIELCSIQNPYERQCKLDELEDKAKELNILTRFRKRYKSYMESVKTELSNERPTYMTDFEGQPKLRSGMWRADENGIWILTDKGKVFACSHPIYPRTILQNIENKTCKVELVFKVRNRWDRIYIDRKTIASRNSIIALANHGIRVTSENAGALVQYLSDVEALNEYDIGEKMSTSRLGWVNGVFMPYEEDVLFDNENNVLTLFDSISNMGSYETWLNCIKENRQDKRIELLIYLACSFASVLVEPLGILPFIVDLWGGTGRGKTVALMIAASIWANPGEGEYITDAKSTTTAMEIRLDVLNSLPMLIDDLAQIKNKVDNFGELIYLLCSGVGKGRATKEAGLRNTYSWRNCIITNAEHSLISETMQGGAINRVIDVECGNTDIFKDPHGTSEIVRHNFGFAGRIFVEAIKETDPDEIQKIQKKYYAMLMEKSEETGIEKEQKQLLPMSVILTADELAEKIIFQDGIRLDTDVCFGLLRSKNDTSEGIRAYNYLMETIGSNTFRFTEFEDEDNPSRSERWGKFIGRDQVAIISKHFDRIITEAGSQPKSFLSWANTQGLIETDGRGSFKKVVSYESEKMRSVVIKKFWGMEDENENENDSGFIDISNNLPDDLPFSD